MQRSFGQFCPIALASEVLTQRWTLLIVRELMAGSSRFGEIRRGVPNISASLLKERLETLEQAEIVERRRIDKSKVYEYVVTDAGRELSAVIAQIGEWGQRWARDIKPQDLDPRWLVWAIHRRLDTDEMPPGRTVIQFNFSGETRAHRYFWIVNNDGEVEVCLKNPGYEVDVEVRTTTRVLAEAWRGLRSIKQAIRAGEIQLIGKASLKKAFPDWLLLSHFASVKRKR